MQRDHRPRPGGSPKHGSERCQPSFHEPSRGSAHLWSMPLGFHLYPGGMSENSPTFQRWVSDLTSLSPEGTTDEAESAVPSGLFLHGLSDPTLKRWAIIKCPSGTNASAETRAPTASGACRLEVGDTADRRSALLYTRRLVHGPNVCENRKKAFPAVHDQHLP
jgi:hypothetical protein